ncbi:hypothetical protein KR222_009353 [Zaprionus bogoriensis]|nr:hypothetical protein KR222_009353 [Zaprionus bogoriensis]
MSLMLLKVASTAALYQSQAQQQQQLQLQQEQQQQLPQQQQQLPNQSQSEEEPEEEQAEGDNSFGDSLTQAAERQNIEKMRAKLQQLQHEQQQQYRQQQQQIQLQLQLQHMLQHQQQQQQQQQLQLHASNGVDVAYGDANVDRDRDAEEAGGEGDGEGVVGSGAGETAYLLERVDDVVPIYGTWRTKARRPQPPAPAAAAAAALGTALQHASALTPLQLNALGDGGVDNHSSHDNHHHHHLYERLPKRSATMTPLRDVLRDQLPRPPRLSTQRPPSTALVRRQFSETPGSLALRDEFKPKPFHFPFEGPLPEHFKKGEAERPHLALNNIQDILHNLHINGAMPSKLPAPAAAAAAAMMMMPTGLHIAGSYKNLKSSGIANFFRGKRNKKQMQLSIPLPMFPMGMPLSLYGGAPHQRVAIEQLYAYKPRSPQDINLLALQQQPVGKPSAKKKNKKQQQQQQLLEHGSQQHFVADPFLQNFPPIIAINATRQPQHKRVPFKVNLDIYPVLPPSRPTSVLRNPFQMEYPLPSPGTHLQHGIYQTPFKFPTQSAPPSSNPHMHINFPDQATRYSQQQALYQSQKFVPQSSAAPDDCIYGQHSTHNSNSHSNHNEAQEAQSNQIMVHLNVFPKQKPAAGAAPVRASTNPFYNHNLGYNVPGTGLQRASEREPALPKPPSPIEPRYVAPTAAQSVNSSAAVAQSQQNQTQQREQPSHSISRSDNLSLIDFEHPIVAAEVPQLPQLPQAAALTGHPPVSGQARYGGYQTDHFRFPKSAAHIDQLAAEAQTASLFRFPVEDLIQFQVDDAL